MTVAKRQREIDDEILQLSYMEDKLRRAVNREDADSPYRERIANQYKAVTGRIEDLEAERSRLSNWTARATQFAPIETEPPVTFFGIEEIDSLEVAA